MGSSPAEIWLNNIGGTGSLTVPLYGDYLTGGLAVQATGPNPPTLAAFRNNLYLFAFSGTGVVVEQAFFVVHLLHDLKAGTSPTFHIHWSHIIGAPTGDVKWQLEVSYARGYEVDAFPASTTLSTVHTAGGQYEHHITDDDDMALPGGYSLEPDGMLVCRIFRDPADAADTFANDAYLLGVDLHYEKGQIGTTERNRPFTSAGF